MRGLKGQKSIAAYLRRQQPTEPIPKEKDMIPLLLFISSGNKHAISYMQMIQDLVWTPFLRCPQRYCVLL